MRNKLLLVVFIFCTWISAASAKDLKVLMIGNSFSNSVGTYLPSLVRAYPEHSLELTNAFIGGCPLDKHVKNIKLAQKNPKKGLYKITVWNSSKIDAPEIYSGNLIDLLKKQTYDIVSIQQGSAKSWDWKSYEPYAGELISFIRECQPNAKLWSIRPGPTVSMHLGIKTSNSVRPKCMICFTMPMTSSPKNTSSA